MKADETARPLDRMAATVVEDDGPRIVRQGERRKREPDLDSLAELVRIVDNLDGPRSGALQVDKRVAFEPMPKNSARFFKAVAMRWRFRTRREDLAASRSI
jgi:hypothetical protein